MTSSQTLRAIPVDDRAWLIAALGDALQGGAPVLPVGPGIDEQAVDKLRAADLPEGTAVVVRTSGSSGIPKAVALSAASLLASAEATHAVFGGPGQWLVTLPGHLISGLQMLVRSAAAGIDPVFCDEAGDPAALLAAAETMDHDRRYVSVVPVQLERLLDLAENDEDAADTLRRFDTVLVGGQALSLDLRTRAYNLGVKIRRSYGMTETSGGCVYDGVEIGDTGVRIRQGEVQLSGSCLALGYIDDAELTDDRFIEEVNRAGELVRWYRTGDAGELLGGMLTVTGRIDRVLISGGINVSLDEVERVVREHRGWGSAVALSTGAIGVPANEWGDRPVLVVEAPAGTDREDFEEIRASVHSALGPAAVPEWAVGIEAMPRLAGGKPNLRAIAEWLADQDLTALENLDSNSGDAR
ncbi:AMP-binding protein [Leucobacter sp. CX42]|uniref:AMP-binding protein n=1 Tax=unclassified Leucobacter TaxID=2621730 RepID=UPI0033416EC0